MLLFGFGWTAPEHAASLAYPGIPEQHFGRCHAPELKKTVKIGRTKHCKPSFLLASGFLPSAHVGIISQNRSTAKAPHAQRSPAGSWCLQWPCAGTGSSRDFHLGDGPESSSKTVVSLCSGSGGSGIFVTHSSLCLCQGSMGSACPAGGSASSRRTRGTCCRFLFTSPW